ncbi:MAG: hypothetical protein HIU85_04800 [Proteobacteria bacterium]|nr:hypothetical protein [Pseudomonadota bacterium]
MSIKRSSKSSGTSARKPAAPPGVRHVDVIAPRQMAPGDLYRGWLCKNKSCGLLIAIVPPSGSKPVSSGSDDQLVVIKCPHCGDENLYRWSAHSEHPYAQKSPGS